MSSTTWHVAVGADATTAVWDAPPDGEVTTVFVCAHGAGGNMADRLTTAACSALRARGIATVRFNFFYRARHSSRPDPMNRLVACLHAVVERTRHELRPRTLVLGGRSMGGRAASVAVAEGEECQGLLLLAYPLHPPGQPEKLRTGHLAAITAPVLCVSGTRDPFCDRRLMEKQLSQLGTHWRIHWLAGADHSFHVLKSSGRSDGDMLEETADTCAAWLRDLEPQAPCGSPKGSG